jgi:hypothetical protein
LEVYIRNIRGGFFKIYLGVVAHIYNPSYLGGGSQVQGQPGEKVSEILISTSLYLYIGCVYRFVPLDSKKLLEWPRNDTHFAFQNFVFHISISAQRKHRTKGKYHSGLSYVDKLLFYSI